MFPLNMMAARAGVAVLAAILLPSVGFAQMTRGSIAGTARDASGAVVPGATVTVTNVATNAMQTVVTDGEGFYRVPALEPGRYIVTTELSGFREGGAARRRRARGARDTARRAAGAGGRG